MTQDIMLYFFQTGRIRQKEVNIKLGAGQGEFFTPIPWFLITHPRGNVVIDGGIAVEAALDPVGHWGDVANVYYPVMEPEEGCVNRLKEAGFDPADVKYVIHSHLHLDHTGACGNFPNATHIVQKREYEYAHTADWFAAGGYIMKDIKKPGIRWELLDDEDAFDLYGDGVIQLYQSPGHSPGHQSIMVRLPETGSVLLVIDAAYTFDHWEDKCLPGFLTSAIETAASVKKLRRLAERENAMVVTGHDPDVWPSFRKAPEFYG
ncbi:N-acyl homoserine lactonase AttM [Agrobacterium sp. NPDC090283]|uniref:AttM family quorum-quenching N-acyl homoserine lactonase n=1 Tax=Agrobacterium sp. NPDC090283 TaxID=3363920 RepID=UPI00383A05A5